MNRCCTFYNIARPGWLTVTQLAEVSIVKVTVWHFYGKDYVCNNKISLQWREWKLINEL